MSWLRTGINLCAPNDPSLLSSSIIEPSQSCLGFSSVEIVCSLSFYLFLNIGFLYCFSASMKEFWYCFFGLESAVVII